MNQRTLTSAGAAATALACSLVGTVALAQPAEGLASMDAASEGTTDVAHEGFETIDVAEADSGNATEFKLSAGGLFTSGNSKLIATTGAARFRARRGDNQLSLATAANYTRTQVEVDGDRSTETTVNNYQGRARYDRFLGEGLAAFLAMSARSDKFQGLLLRYNVDPGLAYYFIDREQIQFWGEAGYDFQYDIRRFDNVQAAAEEGVDLDRTDERHSMRLFLGYDNSLNEAVTVNMGVEYLQAVPDTEYWRMNFDLGLTSAIANSLSIATTFSLRYDNTPLPDVVKTDTVTSVSLVYQML